MKPGQQKQSCSTDKAHGHIFLDSRFRGNDTFEGLFLREAVSEAEMVIMWADGGCFVR